MNALRTPAATLACLSFVLAAVVAAVAAPAVATSSYDGGWSVLIVTEKGECDRAYRYPVKIENGSVGYAGSASFTVSGKVGDTGAVTVKVARGDKSANGQGKLTSTEGSGHWVAGSGDCSGTWTAGRRAS